VASPLTGLLLKPIESVEVVDPLTVAVHLNTPWSMFALQLARQPGYIAAPAMIDDPEGAMHPVGTGPFTFDSWVPSSVLKVKKNQRYWQEGLPHLDSIEFRILPDSLSRESALSSGDIDIAQLVEGDQFVSAAEMAAAGELQVLTDEASETDELAIVLNTATEPFSDPIARRAVASALDRDALAEQTSAGAFPPAIGPFEPGSPYYLDPAEAGWPVHDVAEATELADQYRREHGKPLTFSYTTSTDALARAQVIQAQMKEAGIDMTVNGLEFSAIVLAVLTGDYEAATFAMLDTPNLDQSHQFLATEPQEAGFSLNVSRLLDEDIQREMDAARTTADQSAWIESYETVQRRMAENLDWLIFMRNISGVSYANDVHGLTDSPDRAGTFLAPLTANLWIEGSS
jgi:ABC-type transport system substrate-binding protein